MASDMSLAVVLLLVLGAQAHRNGLHTTSKSNLGGPMAPCRSAGSWGTCLTPGTCENAGGTYEVLDFARSVLRMATGQAGCQVGLACCTAARLTKGPQWLQSSTTGPLEPSDSDDPSYIGESVAEPSTGVGAPRRSNTNIHSHRFAGGVTDVVNEVENKVTDGVEAVGDTVVGGMEKLAHGALSFANTMKNDWEAQKEWIRGAGGFPGCDLTKLCPCFKYAGGFACLAKNNCKAPEGVKDQPTLLAYLAKTAAPCASYAADKQHPGPTSTAQPGPAPVHQPGPQPSPTPVHPPAPPGPPAPSSGTYPAHLPVPKQTMGIPFAPITGKVWPLGVKSTICYHDAATGALKQLPTSPIAQDYPCEVRVFLGTRNDGTRWHSGVDLYAPPGTPVIAAESGKVVNAYVFIQEANVCCIIVANDSGTVTNYGEISCNKHAAIGTVLKAGQQLGVVGTMGHTMLHFEMYVHGVTANIAAYVHSQPGLGPKLLNPTKYLLALHG